MHLMIMITETSLEHTSLKRSVVYHGLDHFIDHMAILGSIVVYSRCFLGPQWEITVSAM